jgi:GT2 family glycosyltransferase
MQTPPAVAVVVVSCDPGPYFGECLAGIASLNYPTLSVVVVNVGDAPHVAEEVARLLPGATLVPAPRDLGYAAAANVGAEAAGQVQFLMCMHDDAVLAPNALAAMMEVAFAANAGVVSPKVVAFDSPRQVLELGSDLDRLMGMAPRVEVGDLDQGQYDEVRDVAVASGCALLVRKDLFDALGGFDDHYGNVGYELDLSCRAHMLGARVQVAPHARVRHRQSSTVGPTTPRLRALGHGVVRDARTPPARAERIRAKRRAQAHAIATLEAFPGVVGGIVLFVLERLLAALGMLVTARPTLARSELAGVAELGRLPRLRAEHRALVARGLDPRLISFTGSWLAVRRFVAHQRSSRHQAALAGRAPSRWSRVTGWALAISIVLLLASARGYLLAPAPLVGSLTLFPAPLHLLGEYFGARPSVRLLGTGVLPPSDLIFGILGLVLLGHSAAAVTLLECASMLTGPIAAWRLAGRLVSEPLARVSGALYALGPSVAVALARGSVYELFGFGLVPLVGIAVVDLLSARMRSRRVQRGALLRLAGVMGLAAALAPQLGILLFGLAVAAVLGLVAFGRRDEARSLGLGVAWGAIAALVLNLPWVVALIVIHPSAAYLFSGTVITHASLMSLLFGAGVVSGPSTWVTAAALLVGIAALAWVATSRTALVLALSTGAAVLVALTVALERGVFGGVPLAPAYPLSLVALCAALVAPEAAALLVEALARRRIGLRQLAVVTLGAVMAVTLAAAMMGDVVGQGSPPASARSTLPLVEGLAARHLAVMWVEVGTGPRIVRGEQLTNGVFLGVTDGIAPDIVSAGTPPVTRGQATLDHLIRLALDGRTVNLGAHLAADGVSEVVVVGGQGVAGTAFDLAFRRQLDLAQLFGVDGISVYAVRPGVTVVRVPTAVPWWFPLTLALQFGGLALLLWGLVRRRSWLRRHAFEWGVAVPFVARGPRADARAGSRLGERR